MVRAEERVGGGWRGEGSAWVGYTGQGRFLQRESLTILARILD